MKPYEKLLLSQLLHCLKQTQCLILTEAPTLLDARGLQEELLQ